MSTLAEIEAAAESLPLGQKQELLLFLASHLREQGGLPEPKEFSAEPVQADPMIALDAEYKRGYLKTPEDISLITDLLPGLAVDSGEWE